MLGRTAAGLYWMARYLERAENLARLVEAGFRMALTRSSSDSTEWGSVVNTAGVAEAYRERHDAYTADHVVNFVLRDRANPASVLRSLQTSRENARMVRTALTREVWEAINDGWIRLQEALRERVPEQSLPDVLNLVRQQSALVRGAVAGTMLRNDIYDFIQLGAFVERADNTARILDAKYYVLLPSSSSIGSSLDHAQWEMILRSASAARSFHWLHGGAVSPWAIAEFLVFDARLPRSLRFCYDTIDTHIAHLERDYATCAPSHVLAGKLAQRLGGLDIAQVFEGGLHEFLTGFIAENNAFSSQIELDYRFYR